MPNWLPRCLVLCRSHGLFLRDLCTKRQSGHLGRSVPVTVGQSDQICPVILYSTILDSKSLHPRWMHILHDAQCKFAPLGYRSLILMYLSSPYDIANTVTHVLRLTLPGVGLMTLV